MNNVLVRGMCISAINQSFPETVHHSEPLPSPRPKHFFGIRSFIITFDSETKTQGGRPLWQLRTDNNPYR